MTATNNFGIENKLGEGGFGPVYKVLNYILYFMCLVKCFKNYYSKLMSEATSDL